MTKLLTVEELVSRVSAYLSGKTDFSVVRDWVFDYYVSDEKMAFDAAMEAIVPVLRPYLEWEEGVGDPKRQTRMDRFCRLLASATTAFAERAVFALKFDEIQRLTRKLRDGLITREVYERKMGELSPGDYDVGRIIEWAWAHIDENRPVEEYLR